MDRLQQERLQRAVKRAEEQVQKGLVGLDAKAQQELQAVFEDAAGEISRVLQRHAGPDGRVPLEAMQAVAGESGLLLQALLDEQWLLIQRYLDLAAGNGAETIELLRQASRAPGFPPDALQALPDAQAARNEVLAVVVQGVAEDGLDLSQRLWRNHQALRAELLPALQRAILAGHSATDATRAAVAQGLQVSAEQIHQIEMARAGALGEQAKKILASDEAVAYANARRVLRTEMDRANMMARRAGIYAVEGVAGTRFLLSPRHPRYDICDMHARVNLYGLGAGVYPPGLSPLPAHPNTLSHEEAVFEWEIEEKDRTRDDLMEWLAQRTDQELLGILQSGQKVRAVREKLLQPDEITLPWRQLEPKYGALLEAA